VRAPLLLCWLLLAVPAFGQSTTDLDALESRANVAYTAGRTADAVTLFTDLRAGRSSAKTPALEARALLGLSVAYRGQGNTAAGIQAALTGIGLATRADAHAAAAELLAQLYLLGHVLPAYPTAGAQLDEALRRARVAGDPRTLARVHDTRARWFAATNTIDSALAEVNEGLNWSGAAGDVAQTSGLIALRSTFASRVGLLAEAHADALQARDAAAKVGPRAEASAMFVLAQSYANLSNFTESARLWTDVIARYQSVGPPSGAVLATDARAHVWYELQRDDLVLADVNDAIAGYERLKQRPPALLYSRAALSSLRLQRIGEGVKWMDEANRRIETAPAYEQLQTLMQIGLAHLMLSDGDAAERIYTQGLVAGRARGSLEDEWRAQFGLGRAALVKRDPEGAIIHFDAAASLLEQSRANEQGQELRAAYSPRRVEPHEWLVSSLMLLARGPSDPFTERAFEVAERARVRTLADLTVEARARPQPEQPAPPLPRARPRAEIAARLGPGDAMLEYLVGERDAFGWLLTRTELIGFRLPPPQSLDASVRSALDLIARDDRHAWRQLGEELTATLLGPALDRLHNIRRLIIVADGPLQRLPFAALPVPGEHAYLAQKLTTATTSSGSLLGALVPAMDARASVFTLGADGLESAIKAGGLGDNRVIHIDAPALIDEAAPRDSAVQLKPDGIEDGALRASEIVGLPMTADLVMLSAIRTNWGTLLRGEGMLSLMRAFMDAGARSVVAALWDVGDRETRLMTRAFYSGLEGGLAPDEALRVAQLQMIRAGGDLAAPRVWAAFQASGETRQAVFSPAALSWPAVAFTVMAVAGLAVLLRRSRS
jgi:tetratricopeptide (TPR) repeat protein